MCCPYCKSQDITFYDDEGGNVKCENCEALFETSASIKKRIKKIEKIFAVMVAFMVLTLIGGSFAMYFGIAYRFDYTVYRIVKFFVVRGIGVKFILASGIAAFSVSFISLFVLFSIRTRLGRLREQRKFLRKKGYIYIKEDDVNENN